MEGKSSTQHDAQVYLPIVREECPEDYSEFEIFYHEIIAKLPQNAIEIVRFLKYLRKLFFFQKETLFFSKSVKVANLQ